MRSAAGNKNNYILRIFYCSWKVFQIIKYLLKFDGAIKLKFGVAFWITKVQRRSKYISIQAFGVKFMSFIYLCIYENLFCVDEIYFTISLAIPIAQLHIK